MITVETRPGAIVLLVFALILLGTWGPLLNLAERRGRHTVHTYMVRFYGHANVLTRCSGTFLPARMCTTEDLCIVICCRLVRHIKQCLSPQKSGPDCPTGFQHRICAGANRIWLHPRPVWGYRERRELLVSARPFACEGLTSPSCAPCTWLHESLQQHICL